MGTNTLALDNDAWDLVLDSAGNWAMASKPYATAQDVATACLTFEGECIYDTTLGVPKDKIFGELPPLSYVKQQYINQALTVPEVVQAKVFFSSFTDRTLSGQIQVVNQDGKSLGVTI